MRNDAFDILTLYNPDTEPFPIVYNKEVHKIIEPKKAVRVIKMIGGLALKHLVDRMVQKQGKMINDEAARNEWTSVILRDMEAQSEPIPLTLSDQIKQTTEKLNNNSDLDRFLQNKKDIENGINPPPLTPQPQWKFDPVTGQPLTAPSATQVPNIQPAASAQPALTPEMAQPAHVEIQSDGGAPNGASLAAAGLTPNIANDPAVASILSKGEARVLGEQKMDEIETPATPATPNAKPTREQLMNFAQNTLMMNVDDPKTKAALDAQTDEQLMETLKYEQVA